MDIAEGAFDLDLQRRLWAITGSAGNLESLAGVRSVVLGVNNVLVKFDPCQVDPGLLQTCLERAWEKAVPQLGEGPVVEVPVTYDRSSGSELEGVARHARLPVDEVIRLHTSAAYHVACLGSVPGFAYLVGMPPRISMPRHQTPRARVTKGSVAIGGAQTGILPMDMPSGWHVLGTTEMDLFNPQRAKPCLLNPGDRVRFVASVGAS